MNLGLSINELYYLYDDYMKQLQMDFNAKNYDPQLLGRSLIEESGAKYSRYNNQSITMVFRSVEYRAEFIECS